MSTSYYARISIWGKIREDQFDKLADLLDDEADGGGWKDDIEKAIREGTSLEAEAQEARYGSFDELETWLKENDISYMRYSSNYGCDTFHGYQWYDADKKERGTYEGEDQSVSLHYLKEFKKAAEKVVDFGPEDAPKLVHEVNNFLLDWAEFSMREGRVPTFLEFFQLFLDRETIEEPVIGFLELA